jgi:hypothetical protein
MRSVKIPLRITRADSRSGADRPYGSWQYGNSASLFDRCHLFKCVFIVSCVQLLSLQTTGPCFVFGKQCLVAVLLDLMQGIRADG